MNIWLIKASEPLPTDSAQRMMRMGMMASHLASRSHKVLWWTSSFDHFDKEYKAKKFELRSINPNYQLAILHSPTPYYKNVSLARIKNHRELANSFKAKCQEHPKPDLIICSFPTIELAYESVQFGKKHNIPVIVDVRDMWPDIFARPFPKILHPLIYILLGKMNRQTKYIFSNATALMGMTQEFINWAQAKGDTPINQKSIVVPFGYSSQKPEHLEDAQKFWNDKNIKADDFNICFFGTLGKQFDIETVIDTAKNLTSNKKIKIVICGNGEFLEQYREKTTHLPNILFPGRVGKAEIYSLLRLSKLGLAPYNNFPDFLMSIPNKIAEYLSAGLPILSSIEGAIGRTLNENGVGRCYCDSTDLQNTITEYLDNPALIEKARNSANTLFEDYFEAGKVYNAFAEKIEHLYQETN